MTRQTLFFDSKSRVKREKGKYKISFEQLQRDTFLPESAMGKLLEISVYIYMHIIVIYDGGSTRKNENRKLWFLFLKDDKRLKTQTTS